MQLFIRDSRLIIIILAIVIRAVYASILPFGAAPDEQAHFINIVIYKDLGAIPVAMKKDIIEGRYEIHQAPLYYIISALLMNLAQYFAISPVFLLRFFSILIGVGIVLSAFTYPGSMEMRIKIAFLFALWPTLINITFAINNDGLAILFGSLACALFLKLIIDNPRISDAILAGIWSGFAVLTKIHSLIFFFGFILLFFVINEPFKIRFRISITGLFVFGIIIMPLLTMNYLRYGNPSGAHQIFFQHFNSDINFKFIKWATLEFFLSFWAVFGRTNNVDISFWVRLFGLILELVIIISCIIFINKNRGPRQRAIMFSLITISIMILILIPNMYRSMQFQGRFLFPLLGLFFWSGIYGLEVNRQGDLIFRTIGAGIILSNIWILTVDIQNYLTNLQYIW